MDSGEVVTEFLSQIAMLDPALIRGGEDLREIRSNLAEALTTLADTTNWIMRHGLEDPRFALAGATPYLRMFSLVTAGWIMAKSALAAKGHLDNGTADAEEMRAKLVTARFFCQHILPQVHGLVPAVRAGFEDLFALSPERF
jgi:hypothetical protein